jgi:protein ImuB
MRELWAYVRFGTLQLDSILDTQGQHADDSTQVIAIYDGLSNQLCQLNRSASNKGLKVGMGLAAASALCADLHIIEYNPEYEYQRLTEIAQQLYGLTADISLDKPQGIYLRIDNMLKLYESLEHYWQTITSLFSGLHYQYASAYSISAAKVLANSGYNRVSADHATWRKALQQCPLRHSDLTDKQRQSLQRVGITSFEDLLAQPVSAIAARFDGAMLRYLSELKGERFEQRQLYRPAQKFEKYTELLYEISLSERLLKPLQYLFNHLQRYLIQRALIAFDLDITLHLRDKQRQQWLLHSAQGESRASAWLDIASISVERLQLEAPVQGIQLSVKQLSPCVAANDDLFVGKQQRMSALQLITRLQARLGQRTVYQLQLNNDHRPEHISQPVFPTDGQWLAATTHTEPFSERPSLLLDQPIPLSEPSTIMTAPERIIAGWWSDNSCERDYFIAQNATGQYLWVFRDQTKKWFIYGYFA